jgi:hypothetical protein
MRNYIHSLFYSAVEKSIEHYIEDSETYNITDSYDESMNLSEKFKLDQEVPYFQFVIEDVLEEEDVIRIRPQMEDMMNHLISVKGWGAEGIFLYE